MSDLKVGSFYNVVSEDDNGKFQHYYGKYLGIVQIPDGRDGVRPHHQFKNISREKTYNYIFTVPTISNYQYVETTENRLISEGGQTQIEPKITQKENKTKLPKISSSSLKNYFITK